MASVDDREAAVLDRRQREQVARHLPLVQHTLNRHPGLWRRRRRREPAELIQEGALALIDAVRKYDSRRHGRFAAFAMARIRYAMARYAAEQDQAVRVPLITQRRRGPVGAEGDSASSADRPPRVVLLGERGRGLAAGRSSGEVEPGVATLGGLLRERCELAARRALAAMRSAPRCTAETRRIIDACHAERWSVPDPEARASLRWLAERLGCRVSRVAHCEARFRRHLARLLAADGTIEDLRRAARRHPEGWAAEAGGQEGVGGV